MRRGIRFAPSPTGVFHIGNLRSAWVSKQIADYLDEPWVLRFEDIDKARVLPGAQDQQLDDLKALGLIPHEVQVQSHSHIFHYKVFEEFYKNCLAYPCFCSRAEVARQLEAMASAPHESVPLYSGHCREQNLVLNLRTQTSVAWRFKNPAQPSGARDTVIARSPARTYQNGIMPSHDSLEFSYQWACTLDDLRGNYRMLVRASDLSESLLTQQELSRVMADLGVGEKGFPQVFHTSLLTTVDGGRLEKRSKGVTLRELVTSGYTIENLLSAFKRSFDVDAFTKRNPKVWEKALINEDAAQMSVKDLLGVY